MTAKVGEGFLSPPPEGANAAHQAERIKALVKDVNLYIERSQNLAGLNAELNAELNTELSDIKLENIRLTKELRESKELLVAIITQHGEKTKIIPKGENVFELFLDDISIVNVSHDDRFEMWVDARRHGVVYTVRRKAATL